MPESRTRTQICIRGRVERTFTNDAFQICKTIQISSWIELLSFTILAIRHIISIHFILSRPEFQQLNHLNSCRLGSKINDSNVSSSLLLVLCVLGRIYLCCTQSQSHGCELFVHEELTVARTWNTGLVLYPLIFSTASVFVDFVNDEYIFFYADNEWKKCIPVSKG